jgi:hypothetical protein
MARTGNCIAPGVIAAAIALAGCSHGSSYAAPSASYPNTLPSDPAVNAPLVPELGEMGSGGVLPRAPAGPVQAGPLPTSPNATGSQRQNVSGYELDAVPGAAGASGASSSPRSDPQPTRAGSDNTNTNTQNPPNRAQAPTPVGPARPPGETQDAGPQP